MKMDRYLAEMAARDPCISIRDDEGQVKPFIALKQEIVARICPLVGNCVSEIARTLGVGRSTLYRWEREKILPYHIG